MTIQIQRIEFEQVEGPTAFCRCITFMSWEALHGYIRQIARLAPDDGSYYKCDVRIRWMGGLGRYLRFDLTRQHTTLPAPITRELFDDVRFHAGVWCPPHMVESAYDAYLAMVEEHTPGAKEMAQRFLTCDYDLGVR